MASAKTIQSYDYVNHPYETVRKVLRENAQAVFSNATRTAAARAHSVVSQLHANIAGLEVSTKISITVKNIEDRPRHVTSPPQTRLELEWEAASKPRLFPFMKAELSLYPLTPTETQLDFKGDYEVPMGVVGSGIDNMLLHRIAEASVHRFVDDVAAYLRTELNG